MYYFVQWTLFLYIFYCARYPYRPRLSECVLETHSGRLAWPTIILLRIHKSTQWWPLLNRYFQSFLNVCVVAFGSTIPCTLRFCARIFIKEQSNNRKQRTWACICTGTHTQTHTRNVKATPSEIETCVFVDATVTVLEHVLRKQLGDEWIRKCRR